MRRKREQTNEKIIKRTKRKSNTKHKEDRETEENREKLRRKFTSGALASLLTSTSSSLCKASQEDRE